LFEEEENKRNKPEAAAITSYNPRVVVCPQWNRIRRVVLVVMG
jgi:hypothetical protein